MRKEDGSVVVIAALLLPILIGIIGLTIDGGVLLFRQAALKEATEAAARSALMMSYDKELYEAESRIVVDEATALVSADQILKKNSATSAIENLEIVNDKTIVLETSDLVEFSFMKIFGFEDQVIKDKQIYRLGE